MPPPSQLSIATGAVVRLVKEEASYHRELASQKNRVARLERSAEDEYEIKQEKQAIEETYKIFPTLHDKIKGAVYKLEQQLENDKTLPDTPPDEIQKANAAITSGWETIRRTG
ncbi:hypothetical protein KVT40_003395 [Elsinoe batatas]|uniref:Tubulin-specific chaperone A n=1 Tax=Elsinoe batatas TaxID=2601811 RepID=A0A8K0L8P7_9PEZI|nr:hypothetical protein KVT40_003395 [Elsinoe batatas]